MIHEALFLANEMVRGENHDYGPRIVLVYIHQGQQDPRAGVSVHGLLDDNGSRRKIRKLAFDLRMLQMISTDDCEETLRRYQLPGARVGNLEQRPGSDEVDILFRKVITPQTVDERPKAHPTACSQDDATANKQIISRDQSASPVALAEERNLRAIGFLSIYLAVVRPRIGQRDRLGHFRPFWAIGCQIGPGVARLKQGVLNNGKATRAT